VNPVGYCFLSEHPTWDVSVTCPISASDQRGLLQIPRAFLADDDPNEMLRIYIEQTDPQVRRLFHAIFDYRYTHPGLAMSVTAWGHRLYLAPEMQLELEQALSLLLAWQHDSCTIETTPSPHLH